MAQQPHVAAAGAVALEVGEAGVEVEERVAHALAEQDADGRRRHGRKVVAQAARQAGAQEAHRCLLRGRQAVEEVLGRVVVEEGQGAGREGVGRHAAHQGLADQRVQAADQLLAGAGLAQGHQQRDPGGLDDAVGIQAVAQVVRGDVGRQRVQAALRIQVVQQQLEHAAVAAPGGAGHQVVAAAGLGVVGQEVEVGLGPVQHLQQVAAVGVGVHHAHRAAALAEAAQVEADHHMALGLQALQEGAGRVHRPRAAEAVAVQHQGVAALAVEDLGLDQLEDDGLAALGGGELHAVVASARQALQPRAGGQGGRAGVALQQQVRALGARQAHSGAEARGLRRAGGQGARPQAQAQPEDQGRPRPPQPRRREPGRAGGPIDGSGRGRAEGQAGHGGSGRRRSAEAL